MYLINVEDIKKPTIVQRKKSTKFKKNRQKTIDINQPLWYHNKCTEEHIKDRS